LYEQAQHDFKGFGINVTGVSVDLSKLMAYKDKTVKGLTGGIEHLFKKNSVTYIKGKGSLKSGNQVDIQLAAGGSQSVTTKNILIATGSEVATLPPCPVDNAGGKIVDSTGALALSTVPGHLVVVGGGVIGLEMGSVWRRLGSKITVVEYLDRIVPGVDGEIAAAFQSTLAKQGMTFKLGTKVTGSAVTGAGVSLTVEPSKGGAAETINADVVLVATGRRPYTDGLGLDALGIKRDRAGRIEVDGSFRTAVPSVYAIGDVIDGPMLAHKAEEEGIAAVEIIAGKHGHVNYDAIPGVIYTHPEVASVGKTEEQLKAAGVKYTKGTFPFAANSRARANGDSGGLVKFLADAETDRVLGIHIIGPSAGELIAEGVLAIEYGASSEDIARTCHAHPTLSEAFKEAAMATYSKPIHF